MKNQAIKITPQKSSALSVSYKSPILLDNLLNALPDAVVVTDPNFFITGFNPAAEAYYGLPCSDVMGKVFCEMVKFDMLDTTKDEAIEELFNKGSWNGNVSFTRYNGQKLFFNSRCTLIKDETGVVSAIVIINHNITEEVKQEKNLLIAENEYKAVVESLSEGILLVNSKGIIETSNKKAGEILGLTTTSLKGKHIASTSDWYSIKEDGSEFPPEELPALVTLRTGKGNNDVVKGLVRPGMKIIWLSINSRAIFKEGNELPDAVVVSLKDITEIKEANEKSRQNAVLFSTFMSNSPMLGWVYDEDGNYVYGNPLFQQIVGLTDDAIGKNLSEISTPKTAANILAKNRQVLITGQPLISEDEWIDNNGNIKYFLAHYFRLPLGNKKKLIGGHSIDITEIKGARKELEKMNERFTYALNASSEAVWDHDLVTGEIYRSDAYTTISGYSKNERFPDSTWWSDKIHPEDRERVQLKLRSLLSSSATYWEDEYRFLHKDGKYRNFSDRGFITHEDGKAVRMIGSIQDLTEKKKMESRLLNEQVQKQRAINQATIKAQEAERNRISAELHDNVNQLLMSSRLHIDVANKEGEAPNELLEKASEYLLVAVEEIRALSRELNSTVLSSVGLQKSIADIAHNMKQLKQIETQTEIDESIIERLTPEKQLMLFRIIQEQSNNIIKYAEASQVFIALKEKDSHVHLLISDNGKGFDKKEVKLNGIGFMNIFNRVDSYDGKAEVITSPGNGCLLEISFPLIMCGE